MIRECVLLNCDVLFIINVFSLLGLHCVGAYDQEAVMLFTMSLAASCLFGKE